jgi:orotate phosphoribosyltransferase
MIGVTILTKHKKNSINDTSLQIFHREKAMLELKGVISDYYNQLKGLLYKLSFEYSETPKYKLAYKDTLSNVYVDSRKTTLSPDGLLWLGSILTYRISELPEKIDGVGGLTFGADPISISTATISNLFSQRLYAFSIRKELKNHGLSNWIEGDFQKGDKVIIVDDVVTTGKSTSLAIQRARDSGLKVIKVFVLVDRQEDNGMQNIRNLDVEVEALYTITDLLELRQNESNRSSESHNNQWAISG